MIPVVFGAGKWIASLPTGYLQDRLGRKAMMAAGLVVMALVDVASAFAVVYVVFLSLRGIGGIGWAMFATVATTMAVGSQGARRRGRTVSLLLMSETLGLLVGTSAGGVFYQHAGPTSPFFLEATCMVIAIAAVVWPSGSLGGGQGARSSTPASRNALKTALAIPGVLTMTAVSATLTAIQVGVLVFLYPLYLAQRGHLGPDMVGTFISLSVLGRLASLWVGGSLSDRGDRLSVLVPGLVVYGAVLGTLAFVTHPVLLAAWSVLIGAGSGLVAPIPTAVIGDRVPPEIQGVAIGWLRTVNDGGMIAGPLVFGAVADGVDLGAPFVLAAVLLLVVAAPCRYGRPRDRGRPTPAPAGRRA
jgi:MFS family permease